MAQKPGSIVGSIGYFLVVIIVAIAACSVFYLYISSLYLDQRFNLYLTLPITTIFTGAVGYLALEHIARKIYNNVSTNGVKNEAEVIANLFRLIFFSILAIILLDIVGVNIGGLLVSAGFLGIVVGLAAQSTLGNIFAGITLIISKPFEVNDDVTVVSSQYSLIAPTFAHEKIVPGYSGIVDRIGLLYTKFVDYYNVPFYIPNNIMMQAMVINNHRATNRVLRINIEVSHTVSLEKLEKRIDQVLKTKKIKHASSFRVEYLSPSTYRISFLMLPQPNQNRDAIKGEVLREIANYIGSIDRKK